MGRTVRLFGALRHKKECSGLDSL